MTPNGDVVAWHDVEDPEPQAVVVREIVDRLLSGETIKGLVADLNGRELPPPRAALRAVNNKAGRRR